jgi:Protein of unknown function DUF2617
MSMMIVTIDAPYVDTRASALSLMLGAGLRDAIESRHLRVADHVIQVRLLGASHQVVVETGSDPLCETVACGISGAALPAVADHQGPSWSYRFQAAVSTYAGERFAVAVDQLWHNLASHPNFLGGVFAGSPHAATIVAVTGTDTPARVTWQTWHTYPQTGEIVTTRSEVQLR